MVYSHDKINLDVGRSESQIGGDLLHSPEDLFRTEARILASVMSTRFRQEVVDPYYGYSAELKDALGEHSPNSLEQNSYTQLRAQWHFWLGPMHDFQKLTIDSMVELTTDKRNNELHTAIRELHNPQQQPEKPYSLLGVEAKKRDKMYIFDREKLGQSIASRIVESITTVSVRGPDITLEMDRAATKHLLNETMEDLSLSSDLVASNELRAMDQEYALNRLVEDLSNLRTKSVEERYQHLEKDITRTCDTIQLDTLATIVGLLRNSDTVQVPYA